MPNRPSRAGAGVAPPGVHPLRETHRDFSRLRPVARSLVRAAGDLESLAKTVGSIVRDCVDGVIQTPKTGRRVYEDLQNSEKTYIGTALEIDLRSRLRLKRGAHMDLRLAGKDVDVKFSKSGKWMMPPEVIGKSCILVSADDRKGEYNLGLILVRSRYLTRGKNRDGKRTIRAKAKRAHIWWLLKGVQYPQNFWLTVPPKIIVKISDGVSGNQRMMTLFRELRDLPITRKTVEDVARQLDPTRRVRADRSRGTRNELEREGIWVLSGSSRAQAALVVALGLGPIRSGEYLAHKFSPGERNLARKHGLSV